MKEEVNTWVLKNTNFTNDLLERMRLNSYYKSICYLENLQNDCELILLNH